MYLIQLWTKEKRKYDLYDKYQFDIRSKNVVEMWFYLNTTIREF